MIYDMMARMGQENFVLLIFTQVLIFYRMDS